MRIIRRLAGRVLVLEGGRVIGDASPQEIAGRHIDALQEVGT